MNKYFKKFIAIILSLTILFQVTIPIFANTIDTAFIKNDILQDNIITEDGIVINNNFYTIEEFNLLLDNSSNINFNNNNIDDKFASALIAGTWYIPGIGQAVVTATGIIIVAGATIKVGTWTYHKIFNWFENKKYNKDKRNGNKTDNHKDVYNQKSLPRKGNPNSSTDLKDTKGTKQRRYYDENGNADEDIDYRHLGEKNHKFPHRHK